MRTTVCLTLLLPLLAWPARADNFRNLQLKLRPIELKLDRAGTPRWFDGNVIAPGTSMDWVDKDLRYCDETIAALNTMFGSLDPETRADPRAQKAQQRFEQLQARCQAERAAAVPYGKAAAAAAADRAAEEGRAERRRAFLKEVGPYYGTISNLISSFDSTLYGFEGSGSFGESSIPNYRKELPLVAEICKRYPDLTDPPPVPSDRGVFTERPTRICAMAAEGPEAMIKKGQIGILKGLVKINNNTGIKQIREAMQGADSQISDEIQQMIFDRDAWVAAMDKFYQPMFGKLGEKVPPGLYAAQEELVPELKAFIDKSGTTRAFEMPPFHDAALEGMVKGKVPSTFKGATVLKIGTSYKDWVAYDQRSWVKSDAQYDYYKVEKGKNQFKRGWMLARLPNRPYCQAREWIVTRVRTGPPRVDWLAPGGIFVKCE